MVVLGGIMQTLAFLAESREYSFPLFVLSFFCGGLGMVLQVGIIIYL
jgi:hypothetical protein